MTSDARFKANRQNAHASTGPTSSAGKARASRNAYRHGLGVPIRSDLACVGRIEALARSLAGTAPSAEVMSRAYEVATAQTELERARRQHRQLIEENQKCVREGEQTPEPPQPADVLMRSDPGASTPSDLIAEIHALDRYEQRALARRNQATVAFDTARILDGLRRQCN